jgi:hypothetical protein
MPFTLEFRGAVVVADVAHSSKSVSVSKVSSSELATCQQRRWREHVHVNALPECADLAMLRSSQALPSAAVSESMR